MDGVNLSIRKGEIFGLLGPNGAGKTTTIKMLATILLPTSGKATVLGYDIWKDPVEIRKRINLVSGGERGLYYRVSGRQNLRFFSDLYKVPRHIRDRRVEELLEMVNLTEAGDRRVEDYSRGMKQRLHIARGLVNDPEVLFLDEPTIGLDPEIAHDLRGMIRNLAQGGTTIVLTTHYMGEAEELCGDINMICNGKIVASGPPSMLKDLVRDKTVIEIEILEPYLAAIESVKALEGISSVTMKGDSSRAILRAHLEDGIDMIPTIASRLQGNRLIRISSEEPSLEDAYMSLVTNNDQS
ncbi:MAG: ABC transporter ATP-binding protein [Euryarchaeota archaeon]|nr:ABC transporter ATP-binding protein [Euryarchaeota archaeon]